MGQLGSLAAAAAGGANVSPQSGQGGDATRLLSGKLLKALLHNARVEIVKNPAMSFESLGNFLPVTKFKCCIRNVPIT